MLLVTSSFVIVAVFDLLPLTCSLHKLQFFLHFYIIIATIGNPTVEFL